MVVKTGLNIANITITRGSVEIGDNLLLICVWIRFGHCSRLPDCYLMAIVVIVIIDTATVIVVSIVVISYDC